MPSDKDDSLLLIIDVQREFLNEHTDHVPESIETLLDSHKFGHVVATLSRNSGDSPWTKILGWDGCADSSEESLHPAVRECAEEIFVKDTYGCDFSDRRWKQYLPAGNNGTVYIAGLDTDACVMKNALDLFDLGIRPIVIKDCCASSGGEKLHEAAIEMLERNIGKENVIYSKDI